MPIYISFVATIIMTSRNCLIVSKIQTNDCSKQRKPKTLTDHMKCCNEQKQKLIKNQQQRRKHPKDGNRTTSKRKYEEEKSLISRM